jgi:5-methylcytosine-specific restriction endonuclease McrA
LSAAILFSNGSRRVTCIRKNIPPRPEPGRSYSSALRGLVRAITERWHLGAVPRGSALNLIGLRIQVTDRLKRQWAREVIGPGDTAPLACVWCSRLGAIEWRLHGQPRVILLGGFEWDHRIPTSRGGPNTADNLTPICQRRNRRKKGRTDEEFREYLGLPPPYRLPLYEDEREAEEDRTYYAALDQRYEDEDLRSRRG